LLRCRIALVFLQHSMYVWFKKFYTLDQGLIK